MRRTSIDLSLNGLESMALFFTKKVESAPESRDKLVIPFQLPTRKPPNATSFDIRKQNLEDWIRKLPLAHIGKTAQALFTVLREINSLDIKTAERLRVLESFYPVLEHIDQSIIKHYLGFFFPLPEKNRKIAALAQEFKSIMSIGYKIIIADQLNKEKEIDKKILSTAIHRSLLYLGQSLLEFYEIYLSPSRLIWRDMHWLYQLSEAHNLHNQNNVIPINSQDTLPITIEGIYKQSLLLALAGPYGLQQLEIRKVYYSAGQLQSNCTLKKIDKQNHDILRSNLEIFIVDFSSDTEPGSYNAERHQQLNQIRIFDISALTPILEEHFTRSQSTKISIRGVKNELTANTLYRLILSWGKIGQRGFVRHKIDTVESKAEMVLGLTATHEIILGNLSKNTEFFHSHTSAFVGTDIKIPEMNDENNWDVINLQDSSKNQWAEEKSIETIPQACTLIDKSATGVRIIWKPVIENGIYQYGYYKVEVGQLIALRPAPVMNNSGGGSPWLIGMVRWMKCDIADNVEFGVQLIAPQAIPIFIHSTNTATAQEKDPDRGLLLPELSILNQPATLIIPTLRGHSGDILRFSDINKQIQQVRLKQRLESSISFVRYQFEQLNLPPAKQNQAIPLKSHQSLQLEDKFNDLWAKL